MKIKTVHIVMAFFSLIVFVLLSKYEDRLVIRNFDLAMTVKVQDKIESSKRLRTVKVVDTALGGAEFFASPLFTVAITLLTTVILFMKNSRKKRVRSADQKNMDYPSHRHFNAKSLVIPAALVLLVGVEIVGKSIVHHPGPPFSYIKHTQGLFPDNYINEEFSYPSGHAARSIFVAFLLYLAFDMSHLAFHKRLVLWLALASYVGMVSISKIYLGHHWFSDIVAGLCIGVCIGSGLMSIFMRDHTENELKL